MFKAAGAACKGFLVVVGLLAGVVFSPAFPILSAPLVLSDPVTRTDAIVVLGGGVSKDGRPSAVTSERVLYAAALYQEGFADRLILSTGRIGGFSEAQVMEGIARRAGVPQEALLLEESSKNTYENVRFVQRILQKNGWNRAILVSSPYHMRRVWLIHRKYPVPETLLYAPVRPSRFYENRGVSHRFHQALAVIHEFVGIIWYRMNGYL